jgi:hypothetical protein
VRLDDALVAVVHEAQQAPRADRVADDDVHPPLPPAW